MGIRIGSAPKFSRQFFSIQPGWIWMESPLWNPPVSSQISAVAGTKARNPARNTSRRGEGIEPAAGMASQHPSITERKINVCR